MTTNPCPRSRPHTLTLALTFAFAHTFALALAHTLTLALALALALFVQERPEHDAGAQTDFLDRYVGYVEVCWDGQIQQVSFPIPPYANYFKAASRHNFLQTVDLDGPEKRMKQLAKESFDMISEMKYVEGQGQGHG